MVKGLHILVSNAWLTKLKLVTYISKVVENNKSPRFSFGKSLSLLVKLIVVIYNLGMVVIFNKV